MRKLVSPDPATHHEDTPPTLVEILSIFSSLDSETQERLITLAESFLSEG